jgi:hypothetical protein
MSDSFYEMRKKLNERKRKVEREYRQQAVENVTAPIHGFVDEALAAGNKINKGGSQIGDALFQAQQGNYGQSAKLAGSGMLNTLAGVSNAALSPVVGAIGAMTPDIGVTEYIVEQYGDNPTVREAIRLAQENPMATEAILNSLDLIGLKGSGRALGKSVNAIAENTPTKLDGFYSSPNPISKAFATAKGVVPNAFYAAKQAFVPSSAATRRVVGTGEGRRKEYANTAQKGDANVARGNMLASSFMGSQMDRRMSPNKETVVGNSAEVQRHVADSFDISDTARVRAALSPSGDAPDKILDGAVEHVSAVHGADIRPNQTSLVVRRPGGGEGLVGEALGGVQSAPAVSALANKSVVNKAKAALDGSSDVEFYTDFVTIANYANSFNLKRGVLSDKLPESYLDKNKNVTRSKLLQDYWGARLKQNQLDKLAKKGKEPNKSQVLTKNQQQILDFFDDAPRARVRDRGDGVLSFNTYHNSTAQDLGAVNDWVGIDAKNNKAYVMISDGHDMFGMNPAGGTGLINALPLQSFDIGTRTKLPSAGESADVDLSRIEEITGMKRRPREKVKEFVERVGIERLPEEKNIQDYIKRVGVSMRQEESPMAYQARVMRDFRADPLFEDYLNVADNIVGGGMLASQLSTAEQEDKLNLSPMGGSF